MLLRYWKWPNLLSFKRSAIFDWWHTLTMTQPCNVLHPPAAPALQFNHSHNSWTYITNMIYLHFVIWFPSVKCPGLARLDSNSKFDMTFVSCTTEMYKDFHDCETTVCCLLWVGHGKLIIENVRWEACYFLIVFIKKLING